MRQHFDWHETGLLLQKVFWTLILVQLLLLATIPRFRKVIEFVLD